MVVVIYLVNLFRPPNGDDGGRNNNLEGDQLPDISGGDLSDQIPES